MEKMTTLCEIADQFENSVPNARILVIGDLMLDRYIEGNVTRISPEAPVPIVQVNGYSDIPGGAANVAANIKTLGGHVCLGGVVGEDEPASVLLAKLADMSIDTSCVLRDSSRETTTKTRVTSRGHQIVRYDVETITPLSRSVSQALLECCIQALDDCDVCILSDYAKGVLDEFFCRHMIQACQEVNKSVLVDPKSADYKRYARSTVVTPNAGEAAAFMGKARLANTEDLRSCASYIRSGLEGAALLVTQGEYGMTLFSGDVEEHLPAEASEVADVTGAGDTVVATLALGLASGWTILDSARMANIAAGISVGHHGTWAVRKEELLGVLRTKQKRPTL